MNIPNIAMNSPQMQTIKQMLMVQNLSPENAVRSICKQRGIDVDEFIKTLKEKKGGG